MATSAENISAILKSKIENYDVELQLEEIGEVVSIGDGVATAYGLDNAFYGELLEFESGVKGMVLNLNESTVGIALFGEQTKVHQGMKVKRTGNIMQVPVGDQLVGRVINAVGEPLDGKGPINTDKYRPIEAIASGVMRKRGRKVTGRK